MIGPDLFIAHRVRVLDGNVPPMYEVAGCLVAGPAEAVHGGRCPVCQAWAVAVASITPCRPFYAHRIRQVQGSDVLLLAGCVEREWWLRGRKFAPPEKTETPPA